MKIVTFSTNLDQETVKSFFFVQNFVVYYMTNLQQI